MKANNIDGKIKLFGQLPSTWKNHLNFTKASVEVQQEEGFYDVVTPEYDTELEHIGAIYFDDKDKVFTYPIEETIIDLEVEKANRKEELKRAVEDEIMLALGVGVLEKLVLGEPIPQVIKDTVIGLRAKEQQTIAEIDAFTDPKLLKKYKIKREDVDASVDALKAGRKL